MISYTWTRRLADDDRAQVSTLVRAAAAYDAEAGFTVIEPDRVIEPESGATVWHLPIRAREHLSRAADAPWVVVAYLHLTVDSRAQGMVLYTVHPDYRSRGVTTLLVEELGLDVAARDGWCATGARALRAWAYGSHPASERLTRRFEIPPVARLWTLLRHMTGPLSTPLPRLELPEAVRIDTAMASTDEPARDAITEVLAHAELAEDRRAVFAGELARLSGRVLIAGPVAGGTLGFVWFDPELRTHLELRAAQVHALVVADRARGGGIGVALLVEALSELRTAGAQLVRIRVDPDNEAALRMLRLLSFEQEEAHACYQLGTWGDPPAVPGVLTG